MGVVGCDAAAFCVRSIIEYVSLSVTRSDLCFLLRPMKVISSTCPLSSKITGSSSEKNAEFSSFSTPCASIMGEILFVKLRTLPVHF